MLIHGCHTAQSSNNLFHCLIALTKWIWVRVTNSRIDCNTHTHKTHIYSSNVYGYRYNILYTPWHRRHDEIHRARAHTHSLRQAMKRSQTAENQMMTSNDKIMHSTSVHTWSKIRVKVERWRYAFTRVPSKTKQQREKKKAKRSQIKWKYQNECAVYVARRVRTMHSPGALRRLEPRHQFTVMRINDATVGLCASLGSFAFLRLYSAIHGMSFKSEPYHRLRNKKKSKQQQQREETASHKHYNQINSNKWNSNFISLQTVLIVAPNRIGINHTYTSSTHECGTISISFNPCTLQLCSQKKTACSA